jgi:hypothetical protein
MTTEQFCQRCGAPLLPMPGSKESNLGCPTCLLRLGLENPNETLDWTRNTNSMLPERAHDQVPDIAQLVQYFPNLELQHLVAYGGMGAVYQARQPHLDRLVALKILSPRLSKNPTFAQRFMREARTLARLTHPNIVLVFEFGQAGPLHYLLMEFVDGVNLRDAMLEGKLQPPEALAIIPQLCDALQYAHDEGVVHRDIKPENILLDKKGRVKIADFGLAKLIQPQSEDLRITGTQQVLGTLNYMAPEQIEGRNPIDHRADIDSMGVVFYELLTGELPIGRFGLPSEKQAIDARLDEVVLRTLEKEPQRRFQQASEVKSAVTGLSVEVADAELITRNQSAVPTRSDAGLSSRLNAEQTSATAESGFSQSAKASGRNPPSHSKFPNKKAVIPVLALPFTVESEWGLSVTHGLIKLRPNDLEIEFEVRDTMFKAKISGPKTIYIAYDQIASVRYTTGLLNDSLQLQTITMAASTQIPGAQAGKCTLTIKRADRTQGQQVVQYLREDSGNPNVGNWNSLASNETTSLTRRLDSFVSSLWEQIPENLRPRAANPIQVAARFSSIRHMFVTCGIINLVLLSSQLRSKVRDGLQAALNAPETSAVRPLIDWIRGYDSVINPISPQFGDGYFAWSLFLSIMLFIASERLSLLRNYMFVVAICGVALIPFYPTYLVCAPFAVLALCYLLLPGSVATFDSLDEDGQLLKTQDHEPIGKDALESTPLTFSHARTLSRIAVTLGVLCVGFALTAWIVEQRRPSWHENRSETAETQEVSIVQDKFTAGTSPADPNSPTPDFPTQPASSPQTPPNPEPGDTDENLPSTTID